MLFCNGRENGDHVMTQSYRGAGCMNDDSTKSVNADEELLGML